MLKVVNVNQAFDSFSEHWSPRIVGKLNGQHLKVVKLKGEFVRHKHDKEDELFYVLEGKLILFLDDGKVEINAGEFIIVPKGVYHKPYAPKETKVMLFEPENTLNTGNIENYLTVKNPEKLF